MSDGYYRFLESKRVVVPSAGVAVDDPHAALFPFQRALVRWALAKGRAAIFADTGLGKTLMQLAWASNAGRRPLIVAPLGVVEQTVAEGQRWGIPARYCRDQSQKTDSVITVTNYEMLAHFDPDQFDAVVLDESSILKDFEGKMRTSLIRIFRNVPMRLCCTATPAPNDISEIANHAEFLGIMSRTEMLASFFVHDDEGWRLKGHARRAFYRWMASWAMSLKRPSDLRYSDEGYDLPELDIRAEIVQTEVELPSLSGIAGRSAVRKATLAERVERTVAIIAREPAEQWVVWCGLNAEQQAITAALGAQCLSIYGQDSPAEKVSREARWRRGEVPVLVSKPSIFGHGMNWQHCARMIFLGIGDSYESYYQAIRRCYRFGQQRSVRAYIVLSEPEQAIYDNVLRKEHEAETTHAQMIGFLRSFERKELSRVQPTFSYETDRATGNGWGMLLGDSAEWLCKFPPRSVDLSLFSPPFGSLYTYSSTERDLGNSRSDEQFWQHFGFIIRDLLRVTRPGRLALVHCAQIPLQKVRDGVIGLKDFRGALITNFEQAGWIYHGEVCIDKNPQAQAIRTKSKGLLFKQMHADSSWSRPALADYIVIFRAPGDNKVPISPDLTNDEWIEYAHPVWYGIKETKTLNYREARTANDERHICPLQLETIERCIRLWSNPGEVVLSPFAGIGSEGYQAILLGRRFVGVELKREYWQVAVKNLQDAERRAALATDAAA